MDNRTKGIVATVLAALIWSTAGLVIKLLPQDAFTIIFYRAVYTMLVFYALFRKQVFRFNRQMWINSFFYVGLVITFVTSTKLTTAANSIFLQYTGAAYILLLEPLLFRLPLKRINVWTTVICFAGMILFFLDGLSVEGGWGIGLAALSGVMFAGIFLGQRSNPPEYHVAAVFFGNIWLVLIGMPSFLASAPPTFDEHLMLGFLGFVQMGIGYALFTYGLQRITAIEASLIAMLEPLFNPIWVMIGYGEIPSVLSWVGGAIIIIALVVRLVVLRYQNRRKRKLGLR